jgi:hypothetical protein
LNDSHFGFECARGHSHKSTAISIAVGSNEIHQPELIAFNPLADIERMTLDWTTARGRSNVEDPTHVFENKEPEEEVRSINRSK